MHINDFLFLLSIPKQDQESLSAPFWDCLCQAGATSWSCVLIQIQDYDPYSSSRNSCICYGNSFFPSPSIIQILREGLKKMKISKLKIV